MRVFSVLITLLIVLCCLVPHIEANASKPSKQANTTTPESARFERKQHRIAASLTRLSAWEQRQSKAAAKLAARYTKSASLRASKNAKFKQTISRSISRSISYWAMKRESLLPANVKKGKERLTSIQKLAETALQSVNNTATNSKSKQSSILTLRSSEVSKLISVAPRPYWTLLALTALDSKYKCEVCQRAHAAFQPVADLVHRRNLRLYGDVEWAAPMLEFNSSVSLADREKLQRENDEAIKTRLPVFVVELDIDSNRQLFNDLQLTSAPLIVMLPPLLAPKKVTQDRLLEGLSGKHKFIPQSIDLQPQQFIDFINQATGQTIVAQTDSNDSLSLSQQLLQKFSQVINGLRGTWASTDQVIQSYVIAILTMLSLFGVQALYQFVFARNSAGLIGFLFPTINDHVIQQTVTVEHIHLESKDEKIDGDIIQRSLQEVPVEHVEIVPSASRLRSLPLRMYPLVVAACTFYLFCVSGGIFTLIKGSDRGYTKFANIWSKGGTSISGQYMDQTVAESALVASMYGSMVLLFSLITLISFGRTNPKNGQSSFVRRAVVFIVASAMAFVIACLIFFMYCQIINVYGKKTNYQWGTNWKFLQKLNWQKLIPYPTLHQYVKMVWTMVKSKLL